MDLTNEIVENHGFERINNSMWRKGNVTLQNGYTHEGKTIVEKILSTRKAYKFCYLGKFLVMVNTEEDLIETMKRLQLK